MPYCQVFGVTMTARDHKHSVSLFTLPLAKLQLQDPPIKETSHVFPEHFMEDCFGVWLERVLGFSSRQQLAIQISLKTILHKVF